MNAKINKDMDGRRGKTYTYGEIKSEADRAKVNGGER
jgi:hypothetical protein